MTREEIERLRKELREKSMVGLTPIQEHESALVAYMQAVVQYIDERVDKLD